MKSFRRGVSCLSAVNFVAHAFSDQEQCASDVCRLSGNAETKGPVMLQMSEVTSVRSTEFELESALISEDASCTPAGRDPYSSGGYVQCCSGLKRCVKNWDGGDNWYFKCFNSCSNPNAGAVPSPTTSPPANARSVTLKLLEWNVYYKNKDEQAMARIIQPNNPDVIGLDEFTASKSKMRSALNNLLPQRNYQPQPGWEYFKGYGTYVFYDSNKFEALEGGVESVNCPGTRGGDRAANWAVLKERTTRGVLVAGGIHLTYCPGGCNKTHECELSRLYSKLEGMKSKYSNSAIVWMGDLNRGKYDYIVKNLQQGKIGTRQVVAVDDLSQTRTRTYMTGGVIDYIFGERGVFTRLAGGGTGQGQPGQRLGGGADHFPIYATVRWTPSPSSATGGRRRRTNSPTTSSCVASNVQRRRRDSSCACRRRNGRSSTGLYECIGSSLKFS